MRSMETREASGAHADYYELHTKQLLRIGIDEAWEFFSSPMNLSTITPPHMNFRILSGFEEGITREGMLIAYKVSPVLGIPLTWVTKIINVDAPHSFTDTQLKGPYAEWIHTHRFRAVSGGVEMIDELKYRMPLGLLGKLVHALFVRRQIEDIFAYRYKALDQRFNKA